MALVVPYSWRRPGAARSTKRWSRLRPPEVVWAARCEFPGSGAATSCVRAGRGKCAAGSMGAASGALSATFLLRLHDGTSVEPYHAWHGKPAAFVRHHGPGAADDRSWAPTGEIHPPHLDGYFRATHGDSGNASAGGRTARRADGLRGLTCSRSLLDVPARAIVHAAIHTRVAHIQSLAEEEGAQ